uniref:Uncharacterized protein n=1 Tax=Anopheles atroparvus TaxID=41427 RepID=A0A182JCS1_ANOAO
MDNGQRPQSEPSAGSMLESASVEEEDLFQQRINSIRMQLDDTYNIFVNARESLSSISFETLSERLNSDNLQSASCSNHTVDDQFQQEITLVRDANNQVDVAKSLEQLNQDAQRGNPMEDIPELNKFFKVISDLTEGIKKINGHQQSIKELNEDINNIGEQLTQPSGTQTSLPDRLANMSID